MLFLLRNRRSRGRSGTASLGQAEYFCSFKNRLVLHVEVREGTPVRKMELT